MRNGPRLIEKLSPSKIHYIEDCKLRYILESQYEFNLPGIISFNRYSFLGILIHKLIESYLEENWDLRHFESQWSKVQGALLKQCNIKAEDEQSIIYHLPYFTIKKQQSQSLLNELSLMKGAEKIAEAKISGENMYGKADLVEQVPKGGIVRVTDFKTGPVYNFIDGIKDVPKVAYITQLKTYGLSFWEKGHAPDKIKLRLISLAKDEVFEFCLTEEDYKVHSNYLVDLKSELNDHIAKGDMDNLASPSPKSCTYCDYSNICRNLHSTLKSGLNDIPSMMVIGEINTEFDDLNQKVNITTNGGLWSIHRIPMDSYRILKEKVSLGECFLVKGLFLVEGLNIKYWTRYTTFTAIP